MKLSKELPLIAMVLIPFAYLAYIWNELPEQVPIHWNLEGEIDRMGSKWELIWIPILLPLLTYLLLLIIPKIDPKNKLENMGKKLHSIRFLLTLLLSLLALFIIYSAKNHSLANPNYVILFIGILYLVLGNYFQTVKPNYFIGIRTPWTLENPTVWKSTHVLAGKMWFIGGIVVILESLVLPQQTNLILFLIITTIICLVPIVYSYLLFKNNRTAHNNT